MGERTLKYNLICTSWTELKKKKHIAKEKVITYTSCFALKKAHFSGKILPETNENKQAMMARKKTMETIVRGSGAGRRGF